LAPALVAAQAQGDVTSLTAATWTLATFVLLLWVCIIAAAASDSRLRPRFPVLLFLLALLFPPLLPAIILWVCLVPPVPLVVVQPVQAPQPVPRSRAHMSSV
jgi:hypothetical protein